jgi:hypothetical protein
MNDKIFRFPSLQSANVKNVDWVSWVELLLSILFLFGTGRISCKNLFND